MCVCVFLSWGGYRVGGGRIPLHFFPAMLWVWGRKRATSDLEGSFEAFNVSHLEDNIGKITGFEWNASHLDIQEYDIMVNMQKKTTQNSGEIKGLTFSNLSDRISKYETWHVWKIIFILHVFKTKPSIFFPWFIPCVVTLYPLFYHYTP